MVRVIEFHQHVVIPSVVDGRVRTPRITKLSGQGHARPIEREHIMSNSDAIDRHDPDHQNTRKRKPLTGFDPGSSG